MMDLPKHRYRSLRSPWALGVVAVVVPCALAVLGGALARADGPTPQLVWRRSVGSGPINPPALIDLTADGHPEIVVTDMSGTVAVLRGRSGRILWRNRVSDKALTAPVAGMFTSQRRLCIVAGDFDGYLYLIEGATGAVLSREMVARFKSIPLTLAPRASAGAIPEFLQDVLIAVLDSGAVVRIQYMDDPLRPHVDWVNRDSTYIDHSPSVAGVFDPDGFELFVPAQQGLIHALDIGADAGQSRRIESGADRSGFQTRGRANFNSYLAVGDIDGAGVRDIVFANRQDYVMAAQREGQWLTNKWFNGRAFPEIINIGLMNCAYLPGLEIVVLQREGFTVLDGAAGRQLCPFFKSTYRIVTDLALINAPKPGAGAHLVFGDDSQSINIHRIEPSMDGRVLVHDPLYIPVGFALGANILIDDVDGDGYADILGWGKRGGAHMFYRLVTNVPFEGQSRPWTGPMGQPFRTGWLDPVYFERLDRQQEAIGAYFAEQLEAAHARYDEKDWDGALAHCAVALSINPLSAQGRWLQWKARIARRFALALLAGLAGVALVAFVCHRLIRRLRRHALMKKAHRLEEEESNSEALEILKGLRRSWPGDGVLAAHLARLMKKQLYYRPDSIPIYEEACRDAETGSEYYLPLAHACILADRLSSEALEICEKTRKAYDPRHEIEAFMGRAYSALGQNKRAIERLEDAIKYGHVDDVTDDLFVQLHLEARRYSALAAEVFERTLNRRPGDAHLLEGACLSFIAARRVDDFAVECYEKLLRVDPTNTPVLIQLAEVAYSRGDMERTLELGRQALQETPFHAEGIKLVAMALMALGREDEETIQTIERAARENPGDRDLILALAHTYLHVGRCDENAIKVYKKAREQFVDDVELNMAVATAAGRGLIGETEEENQQLLVESLEKLVELGQDKVSVLLQLAEAYKGANIAEPKARRPYEEALYAHPDDLDTCRLLGAIMMADRQMDVQAVSTMEPYLSQALGRMREAAEAGGDPASAVPATWLAGPGGVLAMGKHMVKTYQALNRNEDALRLLEQLAAVRLSDNDLSRLRAEVSLRADHLESAVETYEQILADHPDDADALANCAIALNQLQRLDAAAMRIYSRALTTNPRHPEVIRVIGRVHGAQSNIPECLKAFNHAIKTEPQCVNAIISDCREIMRKHGDSIDLRWFLARNLIEIGRLDEGLDELEAIYELDPEQIDALTRAYELILARNQQNYRAHLGIGRLYQTRHNLRAARHAMESAFQLAPDSGDVQEGLIELYEALLAEGDDPDILFSLGEVSMRAGLWDRAIACFQRTSREKHLFEAATRHLAWTFMQKGMLDIAFNELKKLPMTDPIKDMAYQLAERFEAREDPTGAKNVYHALVAADIDYRDVRARYERLSETTSDSMFLLAKTKIIYEGSAEGAQRYILEGELGRGAMGIVYRAHDQELDDIVALKILPDSLADNLEAVSRFKAEARSARRLTHPNIVRIHDFGEEQGRRFISMEYVQGTDLRAQLRTGALTLRESLKIAQAVADALAYAHDMGIVHRDIKPANVMITKTGVVKITDFGIAKAIEANADTQTGAILGTPLYMAPEQIRGEKADHRADIYSLGVMLYEMIMGSPPFQKGDLAYQHMNVEPPAMTGIPDSVVQVTLKCLAKHREDRYDNAGALRVALVEATAALQDPADD